MKRSRRERAEKSIKVCMYCMNCIIKQFLDQLKNLWNPCMHKAERIFRRFLLSSRRPARLALKPSGRQSPALTEEPCGSHCLRQVVEVRTCFAAGAVLRDSSWATKRDMAHRSGGPAGAWRPRHQNSMQLSAVAKNLSSFFVEQHDVGYM